MKTLRAGKNLDCGCCGEYFTTWKGYKDQDQDKGYGICRSCQADIEIKDHAEVVKLIDVVKIGLSATNLIKFENTTFEEQRAFAMRCLDKGYVTIKFTAQ